MLTPSRYNFLAPHNGGYLWFNGVSGALYECGADEHEAITALLQSNARSALAFPKLRDRLEEGGFVVEDGRDEIGEIVHRKMLECERHGTLDVTISPTYECNFRCRYCYVQFQPGRMDDEVAGRAVTFVTRALKEYERINITWFGGEPLLCMDRVEHATQEITEAAERAGASVEVYITSNGLLLTAENALRLWRAGARYFHVTLDGGPRHHDTRRVTNHRGGSWNAIQRNVLDCLSRIPEAIFTVRANVDQRNIESVGGVVGWIPMECRPRVQVHVTPIIECSSKISTQLYRDINGTVRRLLEAGFAYYDNIVPQHRLAYCQAEKRGNVHIGPDGAVYKCSPSHKPEVRVGRLGEDGKLLYDGDNYERWHAVPPITEECRACRYLCFCRGGCCLSRLRGTKDAACRNRYEDMAGLIVNHYIGRLAKHPTEQ